MILFCKSLQLLFSFYPCLYSLWSEILATHFRATSGLVSVIHVEYVDFVPELGWQFQSLIL